MPRPRTWTDAQLRAAAASSISVKMTLRALGLSGGGDCYYDVKDRLKALAIDTSHFTAMARRTAWTEAELRTAMDGAASTSEVLRRLGLPCQSVYLKRLRRRFEELGIKVGFSGRVGRARRWSDDDLRAAVASSRSIASVLRALGLVAAGGNYDQIQRRIKALELPTRHFTGPGWSKGLKFPKRHRVPLEEVLVAGRWTGSQNLKERLLNTGLKTAACELCGWAERSIDGRVPIELDHINGEHDDNRIENLRILCPNCHALQPTHRGRNRRTVRQRVS